eukprot:gene22431-34357_t
MAEVVGAKALQLDKWHRAMGYTHLAQSDWDFLRTDPKSKEVKEGLLAYIKGWQNELVFAELYATFDDEIINAIRGGVAYASNNTGGGMHATLYNAHEVRRFPSKKGQSGDGNKWSRHDPPHVSEMTAGVSENGGSNAWVISGNFTENGRPIVANDPHLPFTLPSAWHGMRLTSKELGVDHIGLSVPLIPYIIAGVNGDISNGVTLGRCDVDDIFIEKISEEDNNTIDRKYLDSDGATKPWQRDIVSIPGRQFALFLKSHYPFTKMAGANSKCMCGGEVNEMVTLMTQWNGTMATDLAQPAIFASVKEQFLRTVLSSSINSTRTVDAILGVGFVSGGKMSNDLEGRHSVFFLRLLENHPVVRPLLRRMNQTIEETLYDALVTTYDVFSRATKKKSPSAWRWGQVHTASFSHPLGKAGFPMNLVFNVESGGIPGDVDTVSLGAYLHEKEPVPGLPLPRPLYQQRGFAASSRWVVSFQEDKPADAHIIIAPGNSGRLSSKHYDDKKHILTAPVESGIDHLTRDSFDTEKELEIEIRAGECKAP